MSLSVLIQYYKECFQQDNRAPALENIFNDKFEDLLLLEGEEQILRDALPYYPIPTEYAEKISSKLSVYRKEKSLFYGLYLLTGREEGKTSGIEKLCIPLFLFPAQIIETDIGDFGITVDKDKVVMNLRDLFRFKEQEQDIYTTYVNKLPSQFWSEEGFMQLCKLLQVTFPAIETDTAVLYPKLEGEKEVRKAIHVNRLKQQEGMKLIPAAFFAVLNNSKSFTGVVDELEQMVQDNNYSTSLQAVLEGGLQKKLALKSHRYVAPGNLSHAQQKAITNAMEYPLSLVIGPPGTGKSYTVANLAIDYLAQGKTVLIASKTDTAVDVVHYKIEEMLDELLVSVRAGRSGYQKQLSTYFSDLLSGTNKFIALEKELNPFHWSKLLMGADKELQKLLKSFPEKLEREIKRGAALQAAERGNPLLTWLRKGWIKILTSGTKPLWLQAQEIEGLTEQRSEWAKKYIQGRFLYHLLYTLKAHRKEIAKFSKALRTRASGSKEELFGQVDLQVVLDALPIWLVNMNDVSRVLPLQKELFDLVIIDEATQCDIPSCLPVLQRAKKVVIIGDPKQLRHVSFLSYSAQRSLQEKLQMGQDKADFLNYRDNSILDLLNLNLQSQEQVCFLDEHFRSSSDIISFSNKAFYNDRLYVMKDFPHHEKECLSFCKVKGERSAKGSNEEEARQLISEVKKIIFQEEQISADLCSKIGILSPFREQADFLAKIVQEEIAVEKIEKHQMLLGTAYGFQGEERDVMLLSFALDDNSHHSAYRHLDRADVFNVAITRARNFQKVFYSFDPGRLNASSLVKHYISGRGEGGGLSPCLPEERCRGEVEKYIKEQDFTYWKAYSLMGMQIDFLIKAGDKYLGLDLLGFPEEDVDTIPPERYQLFMRAGLKVFPLPYTSWFFRRTECKDAILKALKL